MDFITYIWGVVTLTKENNGYSIKGEVKKVTIDNEIIIPYYTFSQYLNPIESTNCIKKYQFVECGKNRWKNGFTEVRTLGNARYLIRHDINPNWHVTNIDDMEVYVKNFLHLNGY